jgi:glutathione S-transferase
MVSRITDLYVAPHNTPLSRMRRSGERDQAVLDNGVEEFAKAFSYIEYFMGPGPFAAGDAPTLGDCALTPFIVLLKRTIFPFFDEIPDPTAAGGRLSDWWQAIQANPGCRKAADEYDAALEEFLKWLRDRLARR